MQCFSSMDVMGIIGNWGLPVLFVKLMPLLGEDPGAFSTIFNVIMFGYYLLSNYVIRFSKKKKIVTMWFLCQFCGHLCLKVVHRRATLEDLLRCSNILDHPIQVILMNWQFSNPIKLVIQLKLIIKINDPCLISLQSFKAFECNP